MLAETLIVTTILITSLMIIYLQISNLYLNFTRRSKYDTVNDLYAVNNIRTFIKEDGLEPLITALNTNINAGKPYVYAITNATGTSACPYSTEKSYCSTLKNNLNIKTVIFTSDSLTNLKSFDYTNDFSKSLKNFIQTININESATLTEGYRLIVEFNDNTFSTLKVNNS